MNHGQRLSDQWPQFHTLVIFVGCRGEEVRFIALFGGIDSSSRGDGSGGSTGRIIASVRRLAGAVESRWSVIHILRRKQESTYNQNSIKFIATNVVEYLAIGSARLVV